MSLRPNAKRCHRRSVVVAPLRSIARGPESKTSSAQIALAQVGNEPVYVYNSGATFFSTCRE